MSVSIVFVLVGVVLPTIIQGQHCPKTNKDGNNYCAQECVPFRGCSSSKRKCICDGDCGFSCVKKGCKSPKPTVLTNGKILVNGRKFNDTAIFTCNPGYLLSGSSVRTCRGAGAWDGEEAKCGKSCVDPGVANNTLRREPIRNASQVFVVSDVLHYHCSPGYLIEGKDSITCQADGTWDSIAPKCYRVSCHPPELPANSEVFYPSWFNTSQGAKDGRSVFLQCSPGYHKQGSSQVMTCYNTVWKLSKSFKCAPISCGNPGVPANGRKNGLVYHFKSKVTFYCNKCYRLVGATYRVCNADQTWSDEQPVCQSVQTKCRSISSLQNGRVRLTGTECGARADFSCDKGYNLIGNSQIVCTKYGNWSEKTPYCKFISCDQFVISEKMQANVSGYEYGSTAKFKCKSADYVMSGKNSISCVKNGKWSSKVPECLAPCRVNATDNLISKKIYKSGTKADLKCKENFVVVGMIFRKMPLCLNGTWLFQKGTKFPYCASKAFVERERKKFFKSD